MGYAVRVLRRRHRPCRTRVTLPPRRTRRKAGEMRHERAADHRRCLLARLEQVYS